jgi:hypothetical protein
MDYVAHSRSDNLRLVFPWPGGFSVGLGWPAAVPSENPYGKGERILDSHIAGGKSRGGHNQREHQLHCSPVTSSGIHVKESINQLIKLKDCQGKLSGPAISDGAGVIFSSRAMDDALHEVLEDLFVTKRNLFPATIEDVEELRKRYQIFRYFWRSSDTRAIDQRVTKIDIAG